ncbi:MAG: hypothetical protein HDQ99_03195 [Lachnospiraceae bacterium]|nr:hypothetical protein [Lachnospiraceae bacterium]
MGKKMWDYMDKQIKEIINPLMEGKGYAFSRIDRNSWQWDKYIDDIYQSVGVYDVRGSMNLSIGDGLSQKPGYALLSKLRKPRTTEKQWSGGIRGWEGKEELIRDIILDYRDILEKCCDETIQECVETEKNKLPNRGHYLRFCAEYDTLSEEYYGKMGMEKKDIREILSDIKARMEELRDKDVREVETELLGMAAAYEKRILEEYGGEKKNNERPATCTIDNVGEKRMLYNVLGDIFHAFSKSQNGGAWKIGWEILETKYRKLYGMTDEEREERKKRSMEEEPWFYMDGQIRETMGPLMEGWGYTFSRVRKNIWRWSKYMDVGCKEVDIYDGAGRIEMLVPQGDRRVFGSPFLEELENPRTTLEEWGYGAVKEGWEGKEELLRDIFLDCRDILEKNSDEIS